MEKTTQEILDQILLDFPKIKEFASFKVENDEIKYDFTLDYLKYDIEEEYRDFMNYHSDYEYAYFLRQFCYDLYFYVLSKCHSDGERCILHYNNKYKVMKKSEIEDYMHSFMTPEEIAQETENEKKYKRNTRNHYLENYVDPVVTNPLRWDELSKKEQQVYKDYRRYLLDYTEQEEWWKTNLLTLDEWKDK